MSTLCNDSSYNSVPTLGKARNCLDVILLAALWAPSFAFMKIAVRECTPITITCIRLGLAGILMLFILRLFMRVSLPKDLKIWKHGFIMGIIGMSIPFVMYCYSLDRIPTVLSALLNGTTPITTIILAQLFLSDESITWNKVIGVMMAVFGFVVLFLPNLWEGGMEIDMFGVLLSFLSACCYACSAVYAKRFVPNVTPGVMPTLQLLTSLTYLLPLSLLVDYPFAIPLSQMSHTTWLSILGLSLIGTLWAFFIYYRIIAKQGATGVSMVTYLIPIFSVILGVAFLEESITFNYVIAFGLILFGVLVVNGVVTLPKGKYSS